jgi:hypothetical protein
MEPAEKRGVEPEEHSHVIRRPEIVRDPSDATAIEERLVENMDDVRCEKRPKENAQKRHDSKAEQGVEVGAHSLTVPRDPVPAKHYGCRSTAALPVRKSTGSETCRCAIRKTAGCC